MFEYYFWIWDKAIPKNVCETILNMADWDNAENGTFNKGNVYKEDETFRKTKVLWADPMSIIGCITHNYISQANKLAGWHFNLGELEPIQLGKYEKSGHYDWHSDLGKPRNGVQRKLSCSILLNDETVFEGGNLEFKGVFEQPKLQQGSIIVFPSIIEHRVTPVTNGVRYSAVGWMTGPAFK